MGHYNTVKAGAPFRPSAKLENEVRKFFNGGATVSGQSGKNSVANNNRIYVKNISEENKIPAYSTVTITEKDGVFYADLAADANGFWGIAIETISPLSSGSVVVAGVVSAFVSASGSGDFVAPGVDGKLTRTSSGRGQLLYAGDAEKPGVILLGGGGSSEYNGYFKIIAVPVVDEEYPEGLSVDVRITDGGGSEKSVCYVNNSQFSVPEFNTRLFFNKTDPALDCRYFYLAYDPEKDSVSVENETPNLKPYQSVQIGRIGVQNGVVSVHQDSYGCPRILWFAKCDGGE